MNCVTFLFYGLLNTKKFGLPRWLSGKKSTCQAGDPGLIPGLGRSPEEGNGNPLWYSCLENPMDRGAWYSPCGCRVGHDLVTTETGKFKRLLFRKYCNFNLLWFVWRHCGYKPVWFSSWGLGLLLHCTWPFHSTFLYLWKEHWIFCDNQLIPMSFPGGSDGEESDFVDSFSFIRQNSKKYMFFWRSK